MELILTPEERELVIEILMERQRDLLREISRAAHHDFKLRLQQIEKLLEEILDKLAVAQNA
jgi:hypothetical protein